MTAERTMIELSGLDGANPLSFLAALGLLALVSEEDDDASIEWMERGQWVPLLRSRLDRAALVGRALKGLAEWRSEPVIGLEYQKGGNGTVARDLKPPPDLYRSFLQALVHRSHDMMVSGRSRALSAARRSLDHAAAFATDVAMDNNGNTKPTALHFTAGPQEFLGMAGELLKKAMSPHLEEALFGPWSYSSELPVMGWDSSANRDYALRADNPSGNKKTGVPGADVLAFVGLSFAPVAPRGRNVATTGWSGHWKSGAWTWCLWSVPLRRRAVRTLLGMSGLEHISADVRVGRGICAVFRCRVRRSDQGGYGNFLPADVVSPGKG
jgi:hypothetical protein